MTEGEWLACADPWHFVSTARSPDAARKLRLFMVAWCRHNWDRITLPIVKEAVELAERFAEGKASKKQLEGLFEEGRRVMYGTPLSYLLWPNTNQMASCVMGFCREDMGYAPSRYNNDGTAYREWQLLKATIFRDIIGNPFRPVAFSPEWRTDTALSLARTMYESRDFSAMPILADALQDAGCEVTGILDHCRGEGPHVRGCWVVDLVLGKS